MFKVGSEVVCVKKNAICKYDLSIREHPEVHDIITIKKICHDGWLVFNGFPYEYEYEYWNFRELDHAFANEVIAEIIELVKEEELVKIEK